MTKKFIRVGENKGFIIIEARSVVARLPQC